MTAEAVLARKEIPWIDAWIRWERGTDDNHDNDGDDDEPHQVAATDTFSFHYTGSAEQPDIDIELQGFPSDSEQTWNSTGLTLWRSSEHLCNYFVKEWQKGTAATGNLFTNNRRFLEVGSGLGRGGILALHCLSLTKKPCDDDDDDGDDALLCLTDGDTDVLHHLRNNVERNQPKRIQECTTVKLTCSQLLWGRNHALEFLRHVDNKPFDVLFGSDLIYVKKVIQPLFETVSTLLTEAGCFVMAHCARREGNEVDVGMIFDAGDSFGLRHEIVEEDKDISILIFRRKA